MSAFRDQCNFQPVMSTFGGRADEIGTITDIGQRMSPVEGRADVARRWLELPLIARKRHWTAIPMAWILRSLVVSLLGENGIIDQNEVMNAETLPKVEMPNRDGFISDPRPDVFNFN